MIPGAARRLVALLPEQGCSAEQLRMHIGWSLHSIEEALHQAVAAGLISRHDNRYVRRPALPVTTAAAPPPPPPYQTQEEPMPSKICERCEESLPLDRFGNDSRTEDGKAKSCRDCRGKPAPKAKSAPKAKKAPAALKEVIEKRINGGPSVAPRVLADLAPTVKALRDQREQVAMLLGAIDTALAALAALR